MPKIERLPMVQMLVKVPKEMRDELAALKETTGLSVSQQVRCSLSLWIQRLSNNPDAGQAMLSRMAIGFRATGSKDDAQPAMAAEYDPKKDIEPNRETEPHKWASWSKRQGNYAISLLAKGIWPVDQD